MADPLSEVVSLLQPSAPFSKLVVASAPWAVRRSEMGRPFYLLVLEGCCRLRVDGPARPEALTLREGDFVLIPAARGFATCSPDREPPREGEAVDTPIRPMPGGARVGDPGRPAELRMQVGHCVFGSADADLLVPLLPDWVHVRGDPRLHALAQLLADESRSERPAREVVTARLLEVLLIEALRSAAGVEASPGLVRGLADPRLAQALRAAHEQPGASWTVAGLARKAAMSRSAFHDRFSREIGLAPMEYLLSWRMALARQLLRRDGLSIAEVAERIGYASVSTFGVAFTRHVGLPPGRFARALKGVASSRPAAPA
ncbi:MAG: AraC family transcriptional regulator [Betaproteobacteria bacterium]|nr:AraC family transcriptional regulator [Betaproteobacteria bacterium]MBU6511098.1 AraC family transcriptional regulator [Betaproteobacteria bacterium]MDE1955501.1 AraC family transcriptional regulator [Betaproteobacteria bacterium]MDE2151426.1 AraC family transcriptional regulator [Betaproteobacteria bacterium]